MPGALLLDAWVPRLIKRRRVIGRRLGLRAPGRRSTLFGDDIGGARCSFCRFVLGWCDAVLVARKGDLDVMRLLSRAVPMRTHWATEEGGTILLDACKNDAI